MKKGISLFTAALLAVSAIPMTTSAKTNDDFNGDGLENGFDANLIIEMHLEAAIPEYRSSLLTDELRYRIESTADYNGDGKINTTDSTLLLIGIKHDNKAGDINCDGILDGRDASAILSYYAKKAVGKEYSAEERGLELGVGTLGDYDGNSTIDARDASELLRTYVEASTGKN